MAKPIMPIVTYNSSNPMVDGRQSQNALMIQRGVMRFFDQNGVAMLTELTLANNRRADLIGIGVKGEIIVVEIKSSVEDFNADQKWPQYLEFCDQYYFATHANVPQEIFPTEQGLIIADEYGAEIVRESKITSIHAASRKALTLRIARTSTQRLERVLRYAESTGNKTPKDLFQIGGE